MRVNFEIIQTTTALAIEDLFGSHFVNANFVNLRDGELIQFCSHPILVVVTAPTQHNSHTNTRYDR